MELKDNTPTTTQLKSLLDSVATTDESLQPIVADSASTGMSETTLQDLNREDLRKILDDMMAAWNKTPYRPWGWFGRPQIDLPKPKVVTVLGADEILEGFNVQRQR